MKRKPDTDLFRMFAIDYRAPLTREEKKLFGQTVFGGNGEAVKVFINKRKRRQWEALNTFFHEMTHAWLGAFSNGRWDDKVEERLARQVGNVVEGLFKAVNH